MKEIILPYGRGSQALHVAGARLLSVLTPQALDTMGKSQEEIVEEALRQPIGSEPLGDMCRGKKRILLITSDHTRPLPSAITLPILLREIRRGSPEAEIIILVATGLHRPTTEQELRQKFGDPIVDRERIVIHNARDDAQLADFGLLPSGNRLTLNRLVRQADLVAAEGFIEPHFFAGFSGGRKSILPGVAGKETIMLNHNAHMIASPRACQGSLDGNPIHADMCCAAERAGLAFIMNVILDDRQRIVAAVAGNPETAHAAGCGICRRMAQVRARKADIVVTTNGGYPLDQNVYQNVKCMATAEMCVRRGGAVIVCAGLEDGHGGEAFYHWFADQKDAGAVARAIARTAPEDTLPDQWQAQILARVMEKASVWIATGRERRAIVEGMHLHWAPDADTALAQATALLGETSTVTVIPNGVSVIAVPEDGE
ncbi:MAG: nickel-dependent lactate racemase [Clostridia bacterium]|nr:nickel-dependent lactate racemase [Clostridia bacterium]